MLKSSEGLKKDWREQKCLEEENHLQTGTYVSNTLFRCLGKESHLQVLYIRNGGGLRGTLNNLVSARVDAATPWPLGSFDEGWKLINP
jgi:hypothetical protein